MKVEKTTAAVAHHEAGHFVVQYALRPSTLSGGVSIVPDYADGYLGRVLHEDYETEEMARDQILVAFAGFEAERRFDPTAESAGSGADDENARHLLTMLGESDGEAEWRQRAAALVSDNWTAIQALAGELIEAGTLDPSEAMIVADVARGEATREDLARYRALVAAGQGSDRGEGV